MRLLHTSDWHLGRQFHGASLLEEQAAAMDRIVELAAAAEVDAVLIAGDLYDRAIPPAEAVQLFNDTLARLRQSGAAVVAIAGNHDSHVRVSIYDPLLANFGVTVRGDVGRAHEPVLVRPRHGGEAVAIYPLPYLEPSVDGPALAQGDEAGDAAAPPRLRHEEVTRLALARIHGHRQQHAGQRAVLVAHTFAAGGEGCESERELTVGNVDRVSVETFAGFDYVALGHLHGSQELAGPRLAYSGTPLAYSFSEQHQRKSVRLVELAADGAVSVELLPLEVGRPLRTLDGELEELLRNPGHRQAEAARLRVILRDEALPLQAMARLRQRFPHVAELRHQPPALEHSSTGDRSNRVRQARSALELTAAFFSDQQGRAASEAEAALLREALMAAAGGGER
ncbi:MAG: exonuclease SbcCD subunit D [Vulcanococcus sp.]